LNGSGKAGRRRFLLVLASVVSAVTIVPAAVSGAADGGGVSAHDVAEKLHKIQSLAVDAAAYSGKDKAKAAESAGSIEGVWKTIEDTVRSNEKNSYVIFEGAFDSLGAAAKAGDATKAGKAANQISTAVRGYLSVHPDVPSAAPRAAASAEPPSGSASASSAAPAPSGSAASASSGSAASAAGGSAAPNRSAASAAPAPAAASGAPSPDAAPSGTLARTGPYSSALAALAGLAFALGGLALIAGARRRRLSNI